MGQDIVFPAAGFVAMAVEGLYQARQATDPIDEEVLREKYQYRLRNSTFPKALVLQEDGRGTKVMLTLAKQQNSWYEFTVSSLVGETWGEHSRGLIRLEEAGRQVAPESALIPLEHTTPGSQWYKAMNDAGYNFGPVFQKHLEVETRSGVRNARSRLSLTPPQENYRQSWYPMHPVNIDGCLQTVSLGLFRGNRSDVDAVLIPAIIDSIVILPTPLPETGVAVTSSKYEGIGRPEASKNYTSEVSVYDPSSKNLLFEVKGIHYHQLDVIDLRHTNDVYCQMTWKPDIMYLTPENFPFEKVDRGLYSSAELYASQLIDMAAHKKPGLKVMEVNTSADDHSSLWFDAGDFDNASRAVYKEYHFVTSDATVLMAVQEKYIGQGNTNFSVLDITRPPVELSKPGSNYDLVIVKTALLPEGELANVLQNVKAQLSKDGHVLLIETVPSTATSVSDDGRSIFLSGDDASNSAMTSDDGVFVGEDKGDKPSEAHLELGPNIIVPEMTAIDLTAPVDASLPAPLIVIHDELLAEDNITSSPNNAEDSIMEAESPLDDPMTPGVMSPQSEGPDPIEDSMLMDPKLQDLFFGMNGLHSVVKVRVGNEAINLLSSKAKSRNTRINYSPLPLELVRLSDATETTSAAKESLSKLGWQVEEHVYPFANLKPKSTVVVLDELSAPVLATVNEEQWQAMKDLAAREHKVLWVTTGSQFQVTKPDNALIHGLARTMRAEDPLLTFVTLDVESSTGAETVPIISKVLRNLTGEVQTETEFVERGGVVYVSRVQGSERINPPEKQENAELENVDLHKSNTIIKLQCERIGTLDSLLWSEVASVGLPIEEDMVEVEIVAAGLNFKV